MTSASTAISCQALVKSFGATTALDGLDLEVRTGEVHGFLGPNGAGKTVTMRVLLGLLRLDGGTATLLGGDPWADAVALHRRLAYVPGDTNLWPNLTGGEIIDLLGRLRGGLDPARRAELVDRFDLDVRKKARAYSKGNRQKVALVAALASDAELLILDEPTAGLDPLMEAVFQDCVRRAAADGRTVLLSSHILAEVEKLCDRVTIIRKGRTVQHGSLAELRVLARTAMSVELARYGEVDGEVDGEVGGHGDRDHGELAGMPGLHNLRRQGDRLLFEVDQPQLGAVMQRLATLGIRSLESHAPTLEELFLSQYGTELADAGIAS